MTTPSTSVLSSHFETLPSTHLYVAERMQTLIDSQLTKGTSVVVTCDQQPEGVGAYEGAIRRNWVDSDKLNIKCSILRMVPLAKPENLVVIVSSLFARVISELTKTEIHLKWPNDLVLADGRKVGGLLVQMAPLSGTGKVQVFGPNGATAHLDVQDLERNTSDAKAMPLVISMGLNLVSAPHLEGTACLSEVNKSLDMKFVHQALPQILATTPMKVDDTLAEWVASHTYGKGKNIDLLDDASRVLDEKVELKRVIVSPAACLEVAKNGELYTVQNARSIRLSQQ